MCCLLQADVHTYGQMTLKFVFGPEYRDNNVVHTDNVPTGFESRTFLAGCVQFTNIGQSMDSEAQIHIPTEMTAYLVKAVINMVKKLLIFREI